MTHKFPYSFKYLQKSPEFSDWFIHGEDGGVCDVATHSKDVITRIPRKYAVGIIIARAEFLIKIRDINAQMNRDEEDAAKKR